MSTVKDAIGQATDRLGDEIEALSHRIHAHPELAYQEVQACGWLCDFLGAKGFKVELLYSVPKDREGSWVSMCTDPKGRLIVSDQYGPLYRVTPPPIGGKASDTKVEKLPLEITPQEAKSKLDAGSAVLIDVREAAEYQLSRIEGAELIPMNTVPQRLQYLDGLADEKTLQGYLERAYRLGKEFAEQRGGANPCFGLELWIGWRGNEVSHEQH